MVECYKITDDYFLLKGESFSDVRHLLDKNVASNPASAGLHALASSWSNTASNFANNLVN